MNDRFRFRVWNIETGYLDDCDFSINQMGELIGVQPFNSPYIVEQCTGLKDKNGKFIYEDDIISATTFDGHNRQFIVKYANEDACFGLFITKSMYMLFNNIYDDSLEVIGNIHEKPELLEDK